MASDRLTQFRKTASTASGGISSFPVKDGVLKALMALSPAKFIVDFGAGKGELLELIDDRLPSRQLLGADFMQRPERLAPHIAWVQADLNDELRLDRDVDVAICSEVIEHLENPRSVFRNLYKIIRPGGWLILTMPNQESIRSYLALIAGGHFADFRGPSYPAHITALLRLDLERMCAEAGFLPPRFSYINQGGLPKRPALKWQTISFGLLRGRLFSDNIVMVTQKPAD